MQEKIQLLKNCTVLYVENDKKISNVIMKLYNAIFKKVYFSNNTKEALELFEKYHEEIDLSVIEVNMPTMTGIQMVTIIRKKYEYKHPIIFTTQKTNDDTLIKCLKLGAADYLIKPILNKTHLGVLLKVLKPIYDTKMIYLMNQELEIYKKSADCQLLISKANLEGVITYVNDNFCKVSKYSNEELIGKPHSIVKHPDMKNETYRDLWHTIICGNMWSGKMQNRAKDGSSYYVEAKIFPIKDNNGMIIEFISFRQDITEHVNINNKAKELLKKTKLNYSNVYKESIEKARESVLKEMKNLENIVNLERKNSRNQTSKRAFAENKLNTTTDEKNKEIEKWKDRIKESSSTLERINRANKKLTNESRKFNMDLEVKDKKLTTTQKKVSQLQEDKKQLSKLIKDREDAIKHLEEELTVIKEKKIW